MLTRLTDDITDSKDMNLSKLQEMEDKEAWCRRVGLNLETKQQKLNAVIILQYIQISNHCVAHLKLI